MEHWHVLTQPSEYSMYCISIMGNRYRQAGIHYSYMSLSTTHLTYSNLPRLSVSHTARWAIRALRGPSVFCCSARICSAVVVQGFIIHLIELTAPRHICIRCCCCCCNPHHDDEWHLSGGISHRRKYIPKTPPYSVEPVPVLFKRGWRGGGIHLLYHPPTLRG